jgi:hypothetical protein
MKARAKAKRMKLRTLPRIPPQKQLTKGHETKRMLWRSRNPTKPGNRMSNSRDARCLHVKPQL